MGWGNLEALECIRRDLSTEDQERSPCLPGALRCRLLLALALHEQPAALLLGSLAAPQERLQACLGILDEVSGIDW